jgi:hypothetical protein
VVDGSDLYVAGLVKPGAVTPSSVNVWCIEKRDAATGDLVGSFGSGGVIQVAHTGFSEIYTMVAGSTSFYLGGQVDRQSWRVAKRSKSDGQLVAGFGSGGAISNDPSAGFDRVQSLAIRDDQFFVLRIGGEGGFNRQYQRRSATTGALVASFGVDGTVGIEPPPYPQEGHIIVDDQGLYMAGWLEGNWHMEKRDINTGGVS